METVQTPLFTACTVLEKHHDDDYDYGYDD